MVTLVYTVQCAECTVQVLGWAGDTWSLEPGPALLRPRYGHCGATLAGQVVVVGGRGEEGVVDTVEVGTLYYTLLWSVRAGCRCWTRRPGP